MSRPQRVLQHQAVQAQHGPRAFHVTDRPRQGWRTVKELRDELRFSSDRACREWLARQGIVGVRRGRVILVDGLDVDRALRG